MEPLKKGKPKQKKKGRKTMKLELGQRITFKKELKKITDGSSYISKEMMEKEDLDHKWLDKHREVEHQEPVEGIVVGKRRVAERTLVEMIEKVAFDEDTWGAVALGEFEPQATHTEFINVYLVATNLRGLHRVRPEHIRTISDGDGTESATIYRCQYCNNRYLTKQGRNAHETKYCYKSPVPAERRRQEILKCSHNFQTVYSYIPGEAIKEPSHDECLRCGATRGEAERIEKEELSNE